MFKRKKCGVCGYRFTPKKEEVYTAKAAWIIDECDSTDTTPARWYIDFHCPKCDTEYGLEEGQYGWYDGKEIPYKFCPICGERLITENCEVEE